MSGEQITLRQLYHAAVKRKRILESSQQTGHKPLSDDDWGLLLQPLRHGICPMFYTGKIPNFLNFTREKGVKVNIFGKIMIIEDVLLIYFEQIVIFCAPICSILA